MPGVELGTVTGQEIGINGDGDAPVRILQCTLASDDDPQSVELIRGPGDDSAPANGSEVLVFSAGDAYKLGVVIDDGIDPSSLPGNRKLYAVDGGSVQAFINILKNGTIELNGNADFAVRFIELESGFNKLRDDHNALVATYNTHAHVETGVNTLPPITQGTASVASISNAKVNNVLIGA